MVGPMMPKQTEKVRGHVVITVAGRQYGDPIPMDRDKIITVKQENGAINRFTSRRNTSRWSPPPAKIRIASARVRST